MTAGARHGGQETGSGLASPRRGGGSRMENANARLQALVWPDRANRGWALRSNVGPDRRAYGVLGRERREVLAGGNRRRSHRPLVSPLRPNGPKACWPLVQLMASSINDAVLTVIRQPRRFRPPADGAAVLPFLPFDHDAVPPGVVCAVGFPRAGLRGDGRFVLPRADRQPIQERERVMAFWETADGWHPHTPLHVLEGAADVWGPWFAWRPVRTEGKPGRPGQWVWLRTIERRWFYPAPWFCPPAPFRWREYRLSHPEGGET